ncbi:MAG TPA: DUF362 domain-containing protein [Terriglobales bacterium]|nr:DUF362 domain-containing protein [Terriglobales bacterium]
MPRYHDVRRRRRSQVAILRANDYSEHLEQALWEGLSLFAIKVQHKNVLLKPNLVDYILGSAINTHPLLVMAAAECFRRLGARSITVGEGPGHQRDTQLVLSQAGYSQHLREQRIRFVDLNRDQLVRTRLHAGYTDLKDSVAAQNSSRFRFHRLHAQGEGPSLVRCHPQHEEHVWRRSGLKVWLAQKLAALAGDSGEHSRHLCYGSDSLCHC